MQAISELCRHVSGNENRTCSGPAEQSARESANRVRTKTCAKDGLFAFEEILPSLGSVFHHNCCFNVIRSFFDYYSCAMSLDGPCA